MFTLPLDIVSRFSNLEPVGKWKCDNTGDGIFAVDQDVYPLLAKVTIISRLG